MKFSPTVSGYTVFCLQYSVCKDYTCICIWLAIIMAFVTYGAVSLWLVITYKSLNIHVHVIHCCLCRKPLIIRVCLFLSCRCMSTCYASPLVSSSISMYCIRVLFSVHACMYRDYAVPSSEVFHDAGIHLREHLQILLLSKQNVRLHRAETIRG